MYTICPKCALTLVVTAADLRIAQGFVRCGRCSNVFNALARLSEDRNAVAQGVASATASLPIPPPPAAETQEEPSARAPSPPHGAAAEEPISETALEFNPDATDVTKLFVEQTPDPQWSAATGQFRALLREAEKTGTSRGTHPTAPKPASSAAVASEAAGPTEAKPAAPRPTAPEATPLKPTAVAPEPQADIELDADFLAAVAQTKRELATPAAAPVAPRPAQRIVSRRSLRAPPAPPLPQDVGATPADAAANSQQLEILAAPQAESAAQSTVERGNRASALVHLWSAGTGALAIALAAQAVHHYRHDLAANAQLYKPLTALYSTLGISLVPRWNLGAYDVRQLGASADSATTGRITVRASVKNTAKQAQPLPLLRVTLQDRFGNRIAARDVPPRSYLPSAIPASSFLSAGQRIDAEMAFVDPGSNAVGFEIDACLPAPGGAVACANDAVTR
jgi:predicted Zn finger-like uncharacterized protein